jgi:hypothetical protein
MVMCMTMLLATYIYPNDLSMLSKSAYPLLLYCVLDITGNSWDMVIHHIATLMAGLAMHNTYELQETTVTLTIAKSLILTEISTIFLDLIHLGYRHLLIKLGFIVSFTYFRVIRLPWLLIFNKEVCYFCVDRKDYICGSNDLCNFMWSTGIVTLMSLNIMWFCKIISKILKKNNPKPTIKG